MANPEHVALAKLGPKAIARWRETHYRIPNPTVHQYSLKYQLEDRSASETFEPEFVFGRSKLDLSGAFLTRAKLAGADLAYDDLRGIDLTGCNLRQAHLAGANLNSAHLSRSDLTRASFAKAHMVGCSMVRSNLSSSTLEMALMKGANLSFSNLSYTNLEGADLSGSNLSFADLSWANLTQANLRGANLTATSLRMADLTGADLREAHIFKTDLESTFLQDAILGVTRLINCDLSKVVGLEMTRHTAPSTIALDTFVKSRGLLPQVFLENAGVPAPVAGLQTYLRELTQDFPSVLIIGSSEDREFAEGLRSELLNSHFACWTISADDEEALRSGDMILAHSIYYDCLVLLCSAQSLESSQTSQYFAELSGSIRSRSGQSLMVLATDNLFFQRGDSLCPFLKEELVVDFRGWEDPEVYRQGVASLVSSLSGRTTRSM